MPHSDAQLPQSTLTADRCRIAGEGPRTKKKDDNGWKKDPRHKILGTSCHFCRRGRLVALPRFQAAPVPKLAALLFSAQLPPQRPAGIR